MVRFLGSITEFKFDESRKYRMLVYSGTRIIHSIFPLDKNKKGSKYRRGEMTTQHFLEQDKIVATIPYHDSNGITRYAIGIEFDLGQELETWVVITVENENADKVGKIGSRPFQYINQDSFNKKLLGLHYSDMSELEKLIGKIDKKR